MKYLNYIYIIGIVILLMGITACNSGNTVQSDSTQGSFTFTGESKIAVASSESIIIALVNDIGVSDPTNIKVTSSNNSILSILDDGCTNNTHMANPFVKCSIFVRGNSVGNSTITISADGYPDAIYPISVIQEWGLVAGSINNRANILSVRDNKVYATTREAGESIYVYVSTNSSEWRIVANNPVLNQESNPYSTIDAISSDETHVCVSIDGVEGHVAKGIIRCSKNNGAWFELPTLPGVTPYYISISDGIIYLEADGGLEASVKYCTIDSCTNWNQRGSAIYNGLHTHLMGVFESVGVIESDNNRIYYLDQNESWTLYGIAESDVGIIYDLLYTNNGMFLLPYNESSHVPFEQKIEYNSISNLGEVFSFIGNDINIQKLNMDTMADWPRFAYNNNNVYVSLIDGHIYSSSDKDDTWTNWSQIGNNIVSLGSIYITPDGTKLYSIHTDEQGNGNVYVYSLK